MEKFHLIRKQEISTVYKAPPKIRLGEIVILVLLLCFSSLGLITTNQLGESNNNDRLLNVSVLSRTTADYSSELPTYRLAHVKLSIIDEILRESQPNPEDLPVRLAAVDSLINSPIPNSFPPENPVKGYSGSHDPNPQKIEDVKIENTKDPKNEKTIVPKIEKTKVVPPVKPEKLENPGKPENSEKPNKPDQPNKPEKKDKPGKTKK